MERESTTLKSSSAPDLVSSFFKGKLIATRLHCGKQEEFGNNLDENYSLWILISVVTILYYIFLNW